MKHIRGKNSASGSVVLSKEDHLVEIRSSMGQKVTFKGSVMTPEKQSNFWNLYKTSKQHDVYSLLTSHPQP